jgi:ATP-dependent Zn protease
MLAEALLKYETLDAGDIKAIMSGKETPDKSH